MTEALGAKEYLSRGTDHLGFLGAKLRDLEGYATLAHELIQNADDAPEATAMCFDIRDDALIVDNNGTFTDCGHVEDSECPWKADPLVGHRCDFHRFRHVASGDKRREEGTTGAFGIGFISVYQITDRPELISAGRHWTICEDAPETERIVVCRACTVCDEPLLPPTRFILPWAFDKETPLRTALMVEPVQNEDLAKFQEQLLEALPTAMLFLKNINTVEVKRNGEPVLRIERLREGPSLILSDGTQDQIWHLLSGTFMDGSAAIRSRYPGKIEAKRTAEVALVIPDVPTERGLFCAFLPTEEETGLPFHINADFFPSNDRKRILLGSDYQSEWNREAIKAAASILSLNIGHIRDLLGHRHFWGLIQAVFQVQQEAQKGHRDIVFRSFWNSIIEEIPKRATVYTTKGKWVLPRVATLLESKEEEPATVTLEAMGISVVHPDLRPYFGLLRSETIGVKLLDIQDIIDSLRRHNLSERIALESLPVWLNTDDKLAVLCRELELLFKRTRRAGEESQLRTQLATCSLMRGLDGAFWPCNDVYKADQETIQLFLSLDSEIPFAGSVPDSCTLARDLSPEFSAAIAIERLERVFENSAKIHPAHSNFIALLKWFEDRVKEVLGSRDLARRLASLPIFPTKSDFKPLVKLSLPGNFVDPLGLASIIDVDLLGGRTDFLKELGAERLDFERYVTTYLPAAFADPNVPAEKKRALIVLLARHLGEIRDDRDIKETLSESRLVECVGGSFEKPRDVYSDASVRQVLGPDALVALKSSDYQEAVADLWRWLGMADQPRPLDIALRVRKLAVSAPSPEAINDVQAMLSHLGERFKEPNFYTGRLEELRNMAWLPARGDHSRWFRPMEVFADFQSYLFESQATFLDLATNIQGQSTYLLAFLGIKTAPTVDLVVRHLLISAQNGRPVNKEVYRFLNDRAQDNSLRELVGKQCLLLESGVYVGPDRVFWSAHPFGRYRYQLAPDLRGYGALFSRLGVREAPDHTDALSVLADISAEFGAGNQMLDDQAHAVLIKCWQMLSEAFDADEARRDMLKRFEVMKVIANPQRVLCLPSWIFFEDRAGLSNRFGTFLQNNVIPRPQGASKAMEAVGVQTLTSAVRSHLVECADAIEDQTLSDRLNQRKVQLLRVLETETHGGVFDSSLLGQIRVFGVTELRVQYSLSAFGYEKVSDPESVPAHYMRAERALYYVRQNGSPPWAALGRELALALFPDMEPGRFASGIKEVLSAGTLDEAKTVLDELGFPVLEAPPEPIDGNVIGKLGGAETPETAPINEPGPTEDTPAITNVTQAIDSILGPDGQQPTPLSDGELTTTGLGTGTTSTGLKQGKETGKDHSKRKSLQKNSGKLRTYVLSEEHEPKSETLGGAIPHRDPVEQAGVDAVLVHERNHGRLPEEKPHNFEGYDVESKNSEGLVVRYIEVKARSGLWDTQGVGLSRPQFDKARELGDLYWLYVVENAGREDERMFRVQDPGRLANQFLYDRGWEQLAEEESPAGEGADSVAEATHAED